jgi:HD superfamily phosphohydrolase
MYIAGEAATYVLLNSINTSLNSFSVIEYFQNNNDQYENYAKKIQIARLGALLHDIGHGPFSHAFEEFLSMSGKKWKHEDLSLEIIYKKYKEKEKSSNNTNKIKIIEIMALLCDLDNIEKDSLFDITISNKNKNILKAIGLQDKEINEMDNFISKNLFLNYLIKEDPYNVDRFNYLILDSNRSGAKEYGNIDVERIIPFHIIT